MPSKLSLPGRNPKLDPSLKLSASTAKGMVTRSETTPNMADKKDGKVNKGIFDIRVIDVYVTNTRSGAWFLILVLLLIFATRNRGYGLNEDWLRTR